MFDAKCRDRDPPRAGRQQQIDRQDAILPATFDDISGLDEHLLAAEIFDRQFVDAAGLVDPDGALGQSLLQRDGDRLVGR